MFDVKARCTPLYRDAIERVVRNKLHMPSRPNTTSGIKGKTMDQIVDLLWDEYLSFEKETPPFKPMQFETDDALKGNLYKGTRSIRYLSPLSWALLLAMSPKLLGVGVCERNWGDVNQIKSGNRSGFGGETTEKKAILLTNVHLQDARIHQNEMEKLEAGTESMICNGDFT